MWISTRIAGRTWGFPGVVVLLGSGICFVFYHLAYPLLVIFLPNSCDLWSSDGDPGALGVIIYIDDGICASKSNQQCVNDTKLVVDDLALAGFILNVQKSKLTPQQTGPWLGFLLDLCDGKYFVPKEKISKLIHSIDLLLASRLVPARLIASVTGQIISMSLALGPVAHLRTRALYDVINTCRFWSDMPPQPVTKFCFGNLPCHLLMVGQSGFPPVLLEWYFLMLALQDMGVIIQWKLVQT